MKEKIYNTLVITKDHTGELHERSLKFSTSGEFDLIKEVYAYTYVCFREEVEHIINLKEVDV